MLVNYNQQLFFVYLKYFTRKYFVTEKFYPALKASHFFAFKLQHNTYFSITSIIIFSKPNCIFIHISILTLAKIYIILNTEELFISLPISS